MGYRCVGGMSVPRVGRVGNEYLHLRGCRWWYEEDAKKVGLFLHLRSCRPERTMEKRAYNTRRIISGIELASFHALSLFRLASLSLSHLLLYSTALTLLSKFHFLFSSIIIFIFLPTRIRVIKICLRIDHWDNWNICCIRFCGCLFS